VWATSDIAGYFVVFAGYKLAGISEKKWPLSNTIKEKKSKLHVGGHKGLFILFYSFRLC